MIKKCAATALFVLSVLAGYSQNDSTGRSATHYLGVQANQLIRQILNFGGANSSINNPYLLTYAVNNSTSGHGLNVGFGYFINDVTDGDATNKRETSIDNLSFRIGWERKSTLGKKWVASYGVDFTVLSNKNETVNTLDNEFSKSRISTTSTQKGKGIGPRLTISYAFTNKLMLGTEINYYFTKGNNKAEVKSTVTNQEWDPNTGTMRPVTRTDLEKVEDKTKRFELTPPVAIFLIVKL